MCKKKGGREQNKTTFSSFRLEADKTIGSEEKRVTAGRAGVFKCITRLILRNTLLFIVSLPSSAGESFPFHVACRRYFACLAGLPIGRNAALVSLFDERCWSQ